MFLWACVYIKVLYLFLSELKFPTDTGTSSVLPVKTAVGVLGLQAAPHTWSMVLFNSNQSNV